MNKYQRNTEKTLVWASFVWLLMFTGADILCLFLSWETFALAFALVLRFLCGWVKISIYLYVRRYLIETDVYFDAFSIKYLRNTSTMVSPWFLCCLSFYGWKSPHSKFQCTMCVLTYSHICDFPSTLAQLNTLCKYLTFPNFVSVILKMFTFRSAVNRIFSISKEIKIKPNSEPKTKRWFCIDFLYAEFLLNKIWNNEQKYILCIWKYWMDPISAYFYSKSVCDMNI